MCVVVFVFVVVAAALSSFHILDVCIICDGLASTSSCSISLAEHGWG